MTPAQHQPFLGRAPTGLPQLLGGRWGPPVPGQLRMEDTSATAGVPGGLQLTDKPCPVLPVLPVPGCSGDVPAVGSTHRQLGQLAGDDAGALSLHCDVARDL